MESSLTSWRPGAARDAIVGFVEAVTSKGPDFVAPAQRIAVFDNDGTLWCERPLPVQVMFALDRLKTLAEADPSLKARQPYKAFLEHDVAAIQAVGKKGVFEVAFAVHAGMTVGAFDLIARAWLAEAQHVGFKRRYAELIYQPQLELLDYLRANGFKTFVVSGGGVDFIRAFSEETYGIPPEQVIGSSVKTHLDETGGHLDLMKLGELDSFDDREVKAQNIWLRIGRRPILAFGNSDGDLAMMRYTMSGDGRRLALLLHHDDADREAAYDRDFALSPLAEALDKADEYGVTVVSMARDWASVFPAP